MSIRKEIPPMLRLALPLVLAELGWMLMGVVDTIMVGHLPHPAETISAVALGQVLYNTLAFGIGGVLLGLDTYISQAHGAGEWDDANRWLLSGLTLAALLAAILMGTVWIGPLAMNHLPADREVVRDSIAFIGALNWGTLPLFVYMTLRRYLQAFNHVRPIAAALVSANLVNIALDWLLLFGHRWTVAGHTVAIRSYGVTGAAISTSLARLYLAAFVGLTVWWVDRRHSYGLRSAATRTNSRRLDTVRLRRLVRLGAPVGGQIFVEVAIFAAVTALIGPMGPVPLAGHEIALNCVAFTFMVPFAISAAASVRVGQAVGRGSPTEAAAAGWTAIGLGSGFMLSASLALLLLPAEIAHAFTHDPGVVAAAVPLLLVGAAFQFFDGVQVTATGALRGTGNTHAGLYVQLIGYWVVAIPVGLFFGYHRHLGAVGLWMGLALGLMIAGVALIILWHRTVQTGIPTRT